MYPAPPTKHVKAGTSGIRRVAPWVAGVAAVGAAFAGGIWVGPQLTGGNQNNDTQPSNTATSKAAPTTSGALSSPTTPTTPQEKPAGATDGVFGPFDSGDAKVFVDGKPREVRGKVKCYSYDGAFWLSVEPPGNPVMAKVSEDFSRVLHVSLGKFDGAYLLPFLDGSTDSEASITKDGNSYRITGRVRNSYANTDTVPFEIDVTCP